MPATPPLHPRRLHPSFWSTAGLVALFVFIRFPASADVEPTALPPAALPPAAPGPTAADWLVHVELTAVELPEKLALSLVDEFDDEADAAYAKLLAAVDRHEAEIVGRQVLHTESGVERTSETIEEIRYPIEFDTPTFPDLRSPKDMRNLPKTDALALFAPVTFETKNTGLSLTASVGVSTDGQRIAMTATPTHVRFLGWDDFTAGLAPQGQKLTIRQPKFFTATDHGRTMVRSGQRFVFGVHKLPDKPRTWELFLFKTWTTRRPLPATPAAK